MKRPDLSSCVVAAPVCDLRRLVELGWEVAYLAIPEFHEAIAAAGGTASDLNEVAKEFGIDTGPHKVLLMGNLW